MANIDTYLQAILEAVYGEEVRGSIHDAIEAMNNEIVAWTGLQDGTVTTRKIASEAVTTEKIDDGAVTFGKLSSGAQSRVTSVESQLEAMKTGFDGETYSSPAAMVQGCDTKLQNEIDDVRSTLNGYYFLINGNKYESKTAGYYIDWSTGNLVQNAVQDHTMDAVKNIPVYPGSTITLKMSTVPISRGGAFYTSTGAYCGALKYTAGTTSYTVTVPETAATLGFTVIDNAEYVVEYDFSEITLKNQIMELENNTLKMGNDYETITDGYYIQSTTGNLVQSTIQDHTMFAVKSVPVISGSKITLHLSSVPIAGQRGGAFYDENGYYVSGIAYTAGTSKYEVVVPERAVTVGFTVFDSGSYYINYDITNLSVYEFSKIDTKNQLKSNDIKDAVCVSDTIEYTQSHNPNCIIDSNKGIMYTVYLAGHGYGDGADQIALAIIPLAQPERTKYIKLFDFVEQEMQGVDPVPIMKDSDTVRVFFTTAIGTPGLYYLDYTISTEAVSQATMCKFNNGSETVDFTAVNFVNYMTEQGKAPNYPNFFLVGSHMVYHSNAYYCTIDIPSTGGYPLIVKTTDNGVTFTPCGIIPSVNLFESDLTFVGNDMYIFLRESATNLYISQNEGASFSASGVVPNASARPRILTYNNKALLIFAKAMNSPVGVVNSRTNTNFYLGTGSTFTNYEKIFDAYDEFGVAVPDVVNYDGILYMIFGSSDLFAISHSTNGKDLLKFYRIGIL